MKKIITNLSFWVLLAIISGALLGHFSPTTAVKMQVLSKYFIEVIKIFINPIIFITLSLGISSMGNLKKIGRVGGKALLYFEIITTLALIIGVIVAWLIKPGSGVHITPANNADIAKYTTGTSTFSWVQFLKDNTTIQVFILSIVFSIFLSRYSKKDKIITPLSITSKYVFKILHIIMLFAPIGAFGGMAYTIGKYGISTLIPLGKLMITVYTTMIIFIFIVLGLILKYYKISIYKFLNYIKEELLLVLGTSSSEAALPSLMEKLENMGCSKPIVGLVIPAGYSFNLDGTTIYLSMAVLFLAQVFNVELTWKQILTIIGVLMVTSKGAAGVTGSGFVVLASTLAVVKTIPIEGLALLLGVDRFMSEARSITNFIGNGVATIFLANHEKDFNRDKMKTAFEHEIFEYDLKNE